MSAQAAAAPARLKRQLGLYALDIGAPIALYYVLRGAGASNIVALSAGAVIPACSTALGAITSRRVDAVLLRDWRWHSCPTGQSRSSHRS